MEFWIGCVVAAVTVWIVYRTLAWSLDSPVLRAAVRNHRLGLWPRLGFAVVAIAAAAAIVAAENHLGPGAIFVAGMLLIFGNAAVLFCTLMSEDLRDVFSSAAAHHRPRPAKVAWNNDEPSRTRRCAPDGRCREGNRPCVPATPASPWRPAERSRSHQRR